MVMDIGTAPALRAGGDEAMPLPLTVLGERPDSLTDQVFEAIRDSIVSRMIEPGSRVSEQKIARQLAVSKTPVREALLRLRHIGLVRSVDRGLCVVGPSIQVIREAYELRAGLERTAVWYAAQRATAADREEFVRSAHESLDCAAADDAAGFRMNDRAFHRLVAQACGNPALRDAVEDSLMLTSVLRERDAITEGDSVTCATEHVAVAQAIVAGDSEEAANQLSGHILHVMSLVLAGHTQRPSHTDLRRTTS